MEHEFVFGHGKICYLEIPSSNIARSAAFFETIFNWKIRTGNDGSVAFDDGVNGVSGVWLLGRKPSTSGIMISIMVDDAAAILELITANGGKVVTPIGRHFPEITASFTDPSGNLWSIYQHRG
jgi:predicted enzyme related to lactoylglutathione lyase